MVQLYCFGITLLIFINSTGFRINSMIHMNTFYLTLGLLRPQFKNHLVFFYGDTLTGCTTKFCQNNADVKKLSR